VRLLAELRLAVVRPLLSSTRWAEAVCLARRLQDGYDDLTSPGAALEEMTKPAGLDDLHA
jgi:hypothetical protein